MKSLFASILLLFSCLSSVIDAWGSFSSRTRQLSRFSQHARKCTTSSSSLRMALPGDISSLSTLPLADYKLVMDSAASGLMCGTADVLAQARERFFGARRAEEEAAMRRIVQEPQATERESVDLGRVARFAAKGLIGGIIWSNWYAIVDGWSTDLSLDALSHLGPWLDAVGVDASWTDLDSTRNAGRIVTAIALEQFIACPLVYAFWDIPVPAILRGTNPREIPGQVRSKIGPLLVDNAKVWTFVNAGVYSAPLEWRVVCMSIADVGWQSVVASVASKELDSADENDGAISEERVVTEGSQKKKKAPTLSLNSRIIEKEYVDDLTARLKR